mmetsp:Transcript_20113/g.77012  ORF Transcript_20113/g.77012 Transcript_20113/m.77012 type:complete len:209 (+) Transcript_20113:1511-2137(+)
MTALKTTSTGCTESARPSREAMISTGPTTRSGTSPTSAVRCSHWKTPCGCPASTVTLASTALWAAPAAWLAPLALLATASTDARPARLARRRSLTSTSTTSTRGTSSTAVVSLPLARASAALMAGFSMTRTSSLARATVTTSRAFCRLTLSSWRTARCRLRTLSSAKASVTCASSPRAALAVISTAAHGFRTRPSTRRSPWSCTRATT